MSDLKVSPEHTVAPSTIVVEKPTEICYNERTVIEVTVIIQTLQ